MIRAGMKTEKMQIREEFSSRIPPLEEEEFRQLEENILSEGCVINPIVTWNGVIVDGHKKYLYQVLSIYNGTSKKYALPMKF